MTPTDQNPTIVAGTCSFCPKAATTHVSDESDVMACCASCEAAWQQDPGFRSSSPTLAAQIEALAIKASQGDWQQVEHTEVWDTRGDGEPGVPLFKGVTDSYRHWGRERDTVQVRDDVALIVLLKNNLPAIVTALRQAEAYPQHIGDLHLGEDRSDGERMCHESHEVPAGHPLYWPQLIDQYDDSDPRCLEHAIERYADHNSYSEPLRQAEGAPVAWRYEYRDSKQALWSTHYSATEVRVQHANCEYVRNPQPLYAAPIAPSQAEAAPGVVEEYTAFANTMLERLFYPSGATRDDAKPYQIARQLAMAVKVLAARQPPHEGHAIEDESRAIELAFETLTGHPHGKDMPDLALAWLANRAEIHAKAVLRLSEALARQHGTREPWQPIESAPSELPIDIWYAPPGKVPCRVPSAHSDDSGRWYDSRGIRVWHPEHVTHWMLAPAAPATDVGEGA